MDYFYINNKFKTVLFTILLCGIFGIIPFVEGYLLPKTVMELYLEHDYILEGKIISFEEVKDGSSTPRTSYEVKVLQPIKGKIHEDVVNLIGLGWVNATRHIDNETIYLQEQKAIFMLNEKTDGSWFISPYTTSSLQQNPDKEMVLAPLKLFREGILTEDIHCKSYLIKATKASNSEPVCLKPNTFQILSQRGWIK